MRNFFESDGIYFINYREIPMPKRGINGTDIIVIEANDRYYVDCEGYCQDAGAGCKALSPIELGK